jgi:L-fucose mutarotase/ribose pyranase (RbsD/FucU family)
MYQISGMTQNPGQQVDIIPLQLEALSAKNKLAHGIVFTGLRAFRGKFLMTHHVMAPQVNACV